MPIQRTYLASDLEKRLKILTMQLHGKKQEVPQMGKVSPVSQVSDISYLKTDLAKIALLASLAIGVQLILYFGNLLNRVKLF